MLPSTYQLPAGLLLVAVGLLTCLAGYRLLRTVLTVYGFLLGAFFASSLVPPSDSTSMIVAILLGGVLGALALYAGYFAGVMLVGAGVGAVASHAVWVQWTGRDPGTLVVLLFAAVGAAIAAISQRYVVVVATALAGAQTAVAGGLALLAKRPLRRPPGTDDVWIAHLGVPDLGRKWPFIAWAVLGVIGIIVQLSSRRGKERR
jgi:hypothetical protein